jgi:pyruvate formate lyase activating enzyme
MVMLRVASGESVNDWGNSGTGRIVLSVNRMTIHNGPGIRTLIVFKECPLRCLWCSTPESQKGQPEIAFYPSKCIRCDRCITVCPTQAIVLSNGTMRIDRSLCNNCGVCAGVCHSEALVLLGRQRTVRDLVEEVKKDEVFYRHSHGGVTISGGEPLLHPHFTLQMVRAFKKEGINTGVDTCGHVPWSNIEAVAPYVDFLLWDLKHLDAEKHKALTGVSNTLILDNIRLASDANIPLYIRVPVIPGYNDSEENIRATCEFVRTLSSVVEVDLIPLHHLGQSRYESLDRRYALAHVPLPRESALESVKKLVESYGLTTSVVG